MKKLFSFTLLLWVAQHAFSQCWNLVWADEFNGSSLDATKWTPQTGAGGWGNNELQCYTGRTENIQVTDGLLKIIARSEAYSGANYTSARLRSIGKGDWTYGKFEARMKLPITQGMWPAFWLLPTENYYGSHPRSGELDIMELVGNQPARVYGTIHTINTSTNGVFTTGANYNLPSGNFNNDFHIFSVEWSPDTIRWYVDNQLYSTKTSANFNGNPWRFDRDFHILLNLALGGSWAGAPDATSNMPQMMEIDYVRVYQQNKDIKILGNALVEPYTEGVVYTLPNILGMTYNWSMPTGGSIVSGQNTPQIIADFGNTSGNVSCQISSTCGVTTLNKSIEVSGNIIKNLSFEEDFFYWTKTAQNGAIANFSINPNSAPDGSKFACLQSSSLGTLDWHIQLIQKNMNLKANEAYSIRFKAKSDVAGKRIRSSVIHETLFTGYAHNMINLTTGWQEYTINFTPPENAPISFNFDCGFDLGTFCFDDIYLGKTSNLNLILPVEIIDFQAVKNKEYVDLNWQVGYEQDILKYEIERSGDGISYEKVGETMAQGQAKYILSIPFMTHCKTNYFRIKTLDKDQSATFTPIKSVENDNIGVKIYPNPATEKLNIQSDSPYKRVWLTDTAGRIFNPELSPENTLLLRGIPKGFYQIHIIDELGTQTVLNFVKE